MNEITIKNQDDVVAFANEYIKKNNIVTSKSYNVTNAMVALYNNVLNVECKNGKTAIEYCTPISIQNAVFECINKELTPSKNQSYFIPYGNELKQTTSYFGLQKMVYDYCGANTYGDVVREGDLFKIENRIDGTKVVYHQTNAQSIFEDKPIIGAYAVASDVKSGRVIDSDIMSTKNILISLSKTKTGGTVHKEFQEEMFKKVPCRRLCKHLLNKSNDEKIMKITDSDGVVTIINSYDELLDDDNNFIDTSYTINTDEQIKHEKEKYIPTEDDVITADNLKLESFEDSEPKIPEGAFEINYNEVKAGKNKDIYKIVPNTFNKEKYTCYVTKI